MMAHRTLRFSFETKGGSEGSPPFSRLGEGGRASGRMRVQCLRQSIFLRLALGAAYTPLSLGDDGRIYTQNDGVIYIVKRAPRSRAIRR
jgi:hypothetical protein